MLLDERKGVQNTIARRRKALEKEQTLKEKYVEMTYFENEILKRILMLLFVVLMKLEEDL